MLSSHFLHDMYPLSNPCDLFGLADAAAFPDFEEKREMMNFLYREPRDYPPVLAPQQQSNRSPSPVVQKATLKLQALADGAAESEACNLAVNHAICPATTAEHIRRSRSAELPPLVRREAMHSPCHSGMGRTVSALSKLGQTSPEERWGATCKSTQRQKVVVVTRKGPQTQVAYWGDHYWTSSSCRTQVTAKMEQEAATPASWLTTMPMRKTKQRHKHAKGQKFLHTQQSNGQWGLQNRKIEAAVSAKGEHNRISGMDDETKDLNSRGDTAGLHTHSVAEVKQCIAEMP